jgi:hypothetical protein
MSSQRLTKRQRGEQVDQLMLLYDSLPGWTVEEVCNFALGKKEIPFQSVRPALTDFGFSESEYQSDRERRRTIQKRLGALPWVGAISFGIVVGFSSQFSDSLKPYVFLSVVGALIVGSVVGSALKNRIVRSMAGKKFDRLVSYETQLFGHVYWSQRRGTDFWKSLSGLAFEQELAKVFRLVGYEATVTHASGDEGVDIILTKDGRRGVVQCKAHKGPVGPQIVRELFGSTVHFNADFAILASISGFTPAAIDFAKQKSIDLLEIPDIIRMQNLESEEIGKTKEELEDETKRLRSELLKLYDPDTVLTPELVEWIQRIGESEVFFGVAENRVNAGLNKNLSDALVDVIHQVVISDEPNITKREVAAAFSGYCYGETDEQ